MISLYLYLLSLWAFIHDSQQKIGLRGSPIFIATARAGEFQKYAFVAFPWKKTALTPLFTGTPSHVIMMAEIEMMEKTIAKQTCSIVDSLKTELNKQNIGGDIYQATMVLEEVKRAHGMMLTNGRICVRFRITILFKIGRDGRKR